MIALETVTASAFGDRETVGRAEMNRAAAIRAYQAFLSKAVDDHDEGERKRYLCRNSLFYLLVAVLGRRDLNNDWHFARCEEVQAAPNGYLDVWFREAGKSSIITFGMTIQDILRDPEITVGIFSYSRPIAKAFLRQIKRELEANETLKQLFPDVLYDNPQRDAPRWSEDDGIVVRRNGNPKEATVEAWGLVDAQPTSKHFRLMVYDDVMTKDSVSNPDMVAKVTTAWETSRNLTAEGGATRYIGTRWAHNDTYREILARGAATERRHAVTVDGTADGEPVLWTRERVAEKRREMGPYTFSAQLLLDPAAERDQGFLDEWLRYYEDRSDFSGTTKYLLVDPANTKKKTSDYTAMVVIGLGADHNYYLLDAIRDRLSLTERGDRLFALHRRWRPSVVGYEKYGMQADIEYFKERMRQENYRFEITELGGHLAKNDRIRRLIPIFEECRFFLPYALSRVDYEGRRVDLVNSFVEEEYRAFPVGVHDDMFDCISRICDEALSPLIWPKAYEARARDRYSLTAAPRAQLQPVGRLMANTGLTHVAGSVTPDDIATLRFAAAQAAAPSSPTMYNNPGRSALGAQGGRGSALATGPGFPPPGMLALARRRGLQRAPIDVCNQWGPSAMA